MHISAKFVAFRNAGHFAFCSLLSFFPIAFMVTKRGDKRDHHKLRGLDFRLISVRLAPARITVVFEIL